MPANPVTTNMTRRSIQAVIDAGTDVLAVGSQAIARIPWDGTIVRASAFSPVSGSVQVDVWKDTYANWPPVDGDSITASAPIAISSGTKTEDATLTGWTTSVTRGDVIIFNVDSATTVTKVVLVLEFTVS
jgi:hypothetical protein